MSPQLVTVTSVLGFCLLDVALLGCAQPGMGGGSRDDGADESGTEPSEDSRDDGVDGTCSAWKVSYCGAVEHCGSVSERNECESDVGYVRCLSAAPVASCQEALDAVVSEDDCSDWPKACEPSDIADRAEPAAACQRLHAQKCEWLLYCGSQTSLEACEATLEASEPCSSFTAVLPAADACLDRFATLQCDEPVPSECTTEQVLRK
jgi:hypothetical protein